MSVPIALQKLVLYRAAAKHNVSVDTLERHVQLQKIVKNTDAVDTLRAMSQPTFAKTSLGIDSTYDLEMANESEEVDIAAFNKAKLYFQKARLKNARADKCFELCATKLEKYKEEFKAYSIVYQNTTSKEEYREIADFFHELMRKLRTLTLQCKRIQFVDPVKSLKAGILSIAGLDEDNLNEDTFLPVDLAIPIFKLQDKMKEAEKKYDKRINELTRVSTGIEILKQNCKIKATACFDETCDYMITNDKDKKFKSVVDFFLMFDAKKSRGDKRMKAAKKTLAMYATCLPFEKYPLLQKCLTQLSSDSSNPANTTVACNNVVDARVFDAPCTAKSQLFGCSKHLGNNPYSAVQPQTLSFFLSNRQLYTAPETKKIKTFLQKEYEKQKTYKPGRMTQWAYLLLLRALSKAVDCSAATLI